MIINLDDSSRAIRIMLQDGEFFDNGQVIQEKASPGRPCDPSKSNRVRFNTMLDRGVRQAAKIYAAENDLTVADVIELALVDFLENNI